jgi:hypothetical protein
MSLSLSSSADVLKAPFRFAPFARSVVEGMHSFPSR